jgi:hypothetical protein
MDIEVLDQPWYSYVSFGTSDTKKGFFKDTYSSLGDYYFTNMLAANQLPYGFNFTLKAISWIAPFVVAAGLASLRAGLLELSVSGDKKIRLPMFMIPAGAGVSGISSQALATGGADYFCNGVPDSRNLMVFSKPIEIHSGVSFSVDVTLQAAPAAAVSVWVFLWGNTVSTPSA